MASKIFPIQETTRVSEVRRHAAAVAQSEGLDENAVSDAAIVATELATNLLKHAVRGEIQISSLWERGLKGIEILSIDRGPGVNELSQWLIDGYSSTGTAGTGLGAVARLSTAFDAYSEAESGTVIVSRVCAPKGAPRRSPPIAFGVVSRPVANEQVSGDSWAVICAEASADLLLADGLGHGQLAAEASGKAVAAFRENRDTAPVALLEKVHAALKGTRGAAVAVAHITFQQASCQFGGIGNIAGRIVGSDSAQHMVSHVGTAGYEARRFQEFTYALPPLAAIIMHSDGLSSDWRLDRYPGLLSHDPALIAAVLYRDASRERDDACVLVAKFTKSL